MVGVICSWYIFAHLIIFYLGDDQEDPHFPSSASNKFSVDGFIMDGSIVDESFVDRCIMDGSIEDGWVVYGFIIDDLFLGNLKIDRCPHRLIRTDLSTQMLSTPSLWTITLRLHLLIHSIYMLCNILTERLWNHYVDTRLVSISTILN